ncbi:hypothetical protein BH24DEI2_BH24DEI2_09540 [soil metagenome]
MERKYIVELKSPLQEPQLSLVAAEVGKELKISPEKFSTLLRRGAGPLTKGVDASVAERIARVARAAGAEIELIENGSVAQAVAVAPAPERTPVSAQASPEVSRAAEPGFSSDFASDFDSVPKPSVTIAAAPTEVALPAVAFGETAASFETSPSAASPANSWEAESPTHDFGEVDSAGAVGEAGVTTDVQEEVYSAARADAAEPAAEPATEPAAPSQRAPWLIPAVLVVIVALVVVAYLALR